MNRSIAIVALATAVIYGAQAQEHIHKQDLREKLFSGSALVQTGVSAVWGTAVNAPHEWERSWEGFGKRAASSYGQRATKGLVEFSLAEVTHENLHYRRSNLHGTLPRLKFAVLRTFWVPQDVGKGYTFATGRVAGAFAAGQVSRAWMPDRVATFGAGMQRTGFSLGFDVAWNIVNEFWSRRR